MFRKVPFLVIDHLSNFDDFIQNYFWVIPKITFANLCKPVQGVIIIPVSSDPLILETDKRKGKKYKKLSIWKTKRAFYVIKKYFSWFLKCFLLVKYKTGDTGFNCGALQTRPYLVHSRKTLIIKNDVIDSFGF